MEYGIRIDSPDAALDAATLDPLGCSPGWLCALLPPAPLAALYFGSEFCQDRIPSARDALAFCRNASAAGLEAVLLTPIVTHNGLGRLASLFDELASNKLTPAVVCNDWGVFNHLTLFHPNMPRRLGKLMNRGLRDPRLYRDNGDGPAPVNPLKGARIRELAKRQGASALETDADLEAGFLGDGSEGLQRTLHLPYTFAASGRNCLEKAAAIREEHGGFTKALGRGCAGRGCGGTPKSENREDTDLPMWRAGNTVFFEPPARWVEPHLALADRIVLHRRPSP